ncbi:prolyl 4-hydroxylase subunit alpha-1-like [Drosophila serrata]|uniref:prolyl 4-hydroxylase subunit alpha-1-like n=1 Tax=Drosophila serrata TaxID=7274 RepID=UPI000A1CFA8C|nr:prolyl 4-hydroxylase subunit alpha-1-like [Drosophila serrata]
MVNLRFLLLILTPFFGLQIKAEFKTWPDPYNVAISSERQLSLLKLKERQVNNLYNYREELKSHLKHVQLAVKHSRELLKSASHYPNNLLIGFKLIRHLRNDWPQYLKFMNTKLGTEEIAFSQEQLSTLPTSEDFIDALTAIYKLQTIYDLDAADMASGILDGKQYNVKNWGTDECLILGLMYQTVKLYDKSEYWLQLALFYYSEYSHQKQLDVTLWKYHNILESIVEAYKGMGNYIDAKQYALEILAIQPNHTYMLSQIPKLDYLEKNPANITEVEKDFQRQKRLCTKSYMKRLANLYCYYESWSPFLRLAPIKVEELSEEIYLNIFPDFISQKEIDVLKNAAKTNLQRVEDLSWNCSCMVAELSGSSNNVIHNINRRIMDITGMRIDKNDMLQVINYGMAGNYNPDDTEKSENVHKGNVLIFLSNAEHGGETVFDSLELKVKPIKGSMLIWANSQDIVLHHQCPLLKGNMWLASKKLN